MLVRGTLQVLVALILVTTSAAAAGALGPAPGGGRLDAWLDAAGDDLFGDLNVGAHSLILGGRALNAIDGGELTFNGTPVCLAESAHCAGEQGPPGPQGPQGPAGITPKAIVINGGGFDFPSPGCYELATATLDLPTAGTLRLESSYGFEITNANDIRMGLLPSGAGCASLIPGPGVSIFPRQTGELGRSVTIPEASSKTYTLYLLHDSSYATNRVLYSELSLMFFPS